MRVLPALLALFLVLPGCFSSGAGDLDGEGTGTYTPTESTNTTTSATTTAMEPVPEVVETPWWQSCDWNASVPVVASGAWTERGILNIAHQGGENEVPSATMYALKTALRKGADMLELDVSQTSDGEIVVMHDTTVDRTTDGTGAIESLTLAQVKALDAAYWFVPEQHRPVDHGANASAYVLRGIRTGAVAPPPGCSADDFSVPTLREVLEEFPGVMMNIEIKNGPPQSTTDYATDLADLLLEHGRGHDVIIAAFQDQWTEELHAYSMDALDTSTGTGQTAIAKVLSQGPAPGGPTGFHEAYQVPVTFSTNGSPDIEVVDMDCDFITDAHANGMAVHVWTINDPATMGWLIDCGVDGIMTAEPAVLEAVLQERGVAVPNGS